MLSFYHIHYGKLTQCIIIFKSEYLTKNIHFVRLPFDWRTPSLYLIALSIEFATGFWALRVTDFLLNVILGSCDMIKAIATDLKEDLKIMKTKFKADRDSLQLKQAICQFVDLHSVANQLSGQCKGNGNMTSFN